MGQSCHSVVSGVLLTAPHCLLAYRLPSWPSSELSFAGLIFTLLFSPRERLAFLCIIFKNLL